MTKVKEICSHLPFLVNRRTLCTPVPPPSQCVIEASPDNESADRIFAVDHWSEVDIDDLAMNRTAVWFLDARGCDYFMPAIVSSIVFLVNNGWADEGIDLFDHFDAKLKKLSLEPSGQTLGDESESMFQFARSVVHDRLRERGWID